MAEGRPAMIISSISSYLRVGCDPRKESKIGSCPMKLARLIPNQGYRLLRLFQSAVYMIILCSPRFVPRLAGLSHLQLLPIDLQRRLKECLFG
jgi:hypothetical protein